MKLFYRGQGYTTHTASVQTAVATVEGTYRGVKANFSHQQAPVAHNAKLTYRGTHYAG
jgi:hypothetical protein